MTETLTSAQYRAMYGSKAKPVKDKLSNAEGRKLLKTGRADKKPGNGDKAKAEMLQVLIDLGVEFETEYKFHPTRKWRFDWAIKSAMVAIEYEGVFGGGASRHTNAMGYSKDTLKYNAAGELGWTVLRYTAVTYKNLRGDLKEILTK